MEIGNDTTGSLPRPNIGGVNSFAAAGATEAGLQNRGSSSVVDGEYTMRSSDGAIGINGLR